MDIDSLETFSKMNLFFSPNILVFGACRILVLK
jgi:hypothetical protein